MKRTILTAALLCAAASCAGPAPSDDNANRPKANANAAAVATPTPPAPAVTEADALARENQLYEALKAKNHDAFAAMLADDLTYVYGGGVQDKAETIKAARDFAPASVTLSEARLVNVDRDLYVVNYKLDLDGTAGGRPLPPDYVERASTAWVNRGGNWLAVFHQETIPAEPPPAVAATPPASPSAPPSSTTDALTATEREQQLWELLTRGDFDSFADYLAADQLEVEPVGVFNKAQTLEGVRQLDFYRAALSDFKEVKLHDGATLVTYTVKSPARGFHPAGERHTTIWANRDGRWLAVFHQGTAVQK